MHAITMFTGNECKAPQHWTHVSNQLHTLNPLLQWKKASNTLQMGGSVGPQLFSKLPEKENSNAPDRN